MSTFSDLSSLAEELRSDQRQRWLQGDCVPLEAYLADHPELSRDPEVFLNLAVSEFCLREELGEKPDPSEYARRFPDHSDRLLELIESRRSAAAGKADATTSAGVRRRLTCPFCLRGVPAPALEDVQEITCPHCGKPVLVIEETLSRHEAVIAVLGRFDLLEHLGHGNFGDVWRARDTQLGREVAVKIPRRMPDSPGTRQLFLREAKAAATLQHPNIVPVFEVGREGERLFIVSGLVRGTTLKAWLEGRRFEHAEAARLVDTLAQALEHAHRAGIVHRDLKPGNILLDHDNNPHIADFGLAKQSSDETTLTMQGDVIGTPAYMSPEQARGDAKRVDHRSDIYSLGVVLFELLTGQRPFESKGQVLIHELLNCEPPAPRSLDAAISPDLETICLKALAKDPDSRYESAEDMADDLQRFLNGEPIDARPPSRLRKAWRWARRNRVLAASLTIFFSGAVLMASSLRPNRHHLSMPSIDRRHVVLETQPAGADVHFIPLDEISGEPRGEQIIHASERSPVRVDLPSGDYLVIAVLEGHGFHEVQRHVPQRRETIAWAFNHRAWDVDAGDTIHLPKIKIPNVNVTDGMALIEGDSEFHMGVPGSKVLVPEVRRVPSFYMDPREFTIGDFRRVNRGEPPFRMKDDPPPDDHPLCQQDYDFAMYWAEVSGKRLMSEVEYEFAATARGKHRFPWGDGIPEADGAIDAGIRGADFDRFDANLAVYGLCSGPAEWTNTRPTIWYEQPKDEDLSFKRVVRGGTMPVLRGAMLVDEQHRDPRRKVFQMRNERHPGLGFRCVRSAAPRLRPEDFSTPAPNAKPIPTVSQ